MKSTRRLIIAADFSKVFFPGFRSVIDDIVRKLNQKEKEEIGGAKNGGTYRDI